MIDARSSLHSSVQDRRLVDAYRKWIGSHLDQARFVDLPWFGFSEFYAGLQIADFSAYLFDATSNEKLDRARSAELVQAYERIQSKTLVIRVP
jgi:hypothetical protein